MGELRSPKPLLIGGNYVPPNPSLSGGTTCPSFQFIHQFIQPLLFQRRFHDFKTSHLLCGEAALHNAVHLHFQRGQVVFGQVGMNAGFHDSGQFALICILFFAPFFLIFFIRREQMFNVAVFVLGLGVDGADVNGAAVHFCHCGIDFLNSGAQLRNARIKCRQSFDNGVDGVIGRKHFNQIGKFMPSHCMQPRICPIFQS